MIKTLKNKEDICYKMGADIQTLSDWTFDLGVEAVGELDPDTDGCYKEETIISFLKNNIEALKNTDSAAKIINFSNKYFLGLWVIDGKKVKNFFNIDKIEEEAKELLPY